MNTYFERVNLPSYTKNEEIFNSVSHGVGILFGLLSGALFLSKATDIDSRLAAVIFGLSMMVLYTASTVYHAVEPSYAKKVLRVVDHAVIYVLIEGTSIPLMLVGVMPYNRPFAIVMIALSVIIGAVGTALTYIDQERFKVAQMVLYMVLGWMCLVLIYPLWKYCEDALPLIGLILLGGTVYTVGTVFLSLGRTTRYCHGVFHLFVLAGSLIHFLALYCYLY